jgi:hypothetical protein
MKVRANLLWNNKLEQAANKRREEERRRFKMQTQGQTH